MFVSTTFIGGGTAKQTGEKSHTISTEIALSTPPVRIGNNRLFGTLGGRKTWIANGDFRDGGDISTNDVNLGAILYAPLSDRWSLTLGPTVGIRSTFETDFGAKDLVYNGIFIAAYAAGEQRRLRLSFGFVATNTTNFSPVIPIAGVEYRGERWRIEATYPQPAVFYSVHPRVELGLGMKMDYTSYRIEPSAVGDKTAEFIRTTTHFGHFTTGVNLFADIWLTAKAGVTFGRVNRGLDEDRNTFGNEGRLSLGVAPYGALVLAYRRPPPPAAPLAPNGSPPPTPPAPDTATGT